MKKIVVITFLLFAFVASAQETFTSNQSMSNRYISEVYGTISKDSQLYKNLIDLLSHRVTFINSPKQREKDYVNTSNFPLFNKYNSSLKRDKELNVESFNILKYNLNFYPRTKQIYRFENTDWLLIIAPLNAQK